MANFGRARLNVRLNKCGQTTVAAKGKRLDFENVQLMIQPDMTGTVERN